MQPKNPSQESVSTDAEIFPLPNGGEIAGDSVEEQDANNKTAAEQESVEAAPSRAERDLSNPEQSSVSQSTPQLPAPNNSSVQQVAPSQAGAANSTATDDDTPMIADDVDVIEKEWVDKAKQIIEQTRSNPYRQEQEVERLQQSYLKKRYGKDVSSANQI